MMKFLQRSLLILILLLAVLGICLGTLPDRKLHVFVLDVGQGDAILIRSPANQFILIDGGPDDEVIRQLGKVMPFYEKTLDLVILTHPHADHMNGLIEVLKRYQVRNIMFTGAQYNSPNYRSFLEEIDKLKIPLLFAGNSQLDYQLGSLVFDMIFPFESLQGKNFENLNNSSIAFRLLFGKESFYFAGDLEMEEEANLVRSGLDLRANFLKASHHGSKTSNTPALLDRIKPQFAAISCGIDNPFHHPHAITLQHLQERNVKIYRTDLNGIIEAVSDGLSLKLKSFGK